MSGKMEEQRLSRKEQEKLWRRKHVLSAALELFSKKGYHNISMRQIAKKAEFAIGTLYKFFRNKEDLYKEIVREMAEEYHRRLMEPLERENDAIAAIEGYINAKLDLFSDHKSSLLLYLSETQSPSFNISAGLDKEMQKLYNELMDRLAKIFESAIKRKKIRKRDPRALAISLEGLTNSFLFYWLEKPEEHPFEKDASTIAEIFLKGVSYE